MRDMKATEKTILFLYFSWDFLLTVIMKWWMHFSPTSQQSIIIKVAHSVREIMQK